jgi:hypothetical protein
MQLRQDDLTWQVAGDEVVVLDLKGSVYLKINGTGRVLWEALTEARTDAELTTLLVERFGAPKDRAAADVAHFVDALRARHLLI